MHPSASSTPFLGAYRRTCAADGEISKSGLFLQAHTANYAATPQFQGHSKCHSLLASHCCDAGALFVALVDAAYQGTQAARDCLQVLLDYHAEPMGLPFNELFDYKLCRYKIDLTTLAEHMIERLKSADGVLQLLDDDQKVENTHFVSSDRQSCRQSRASSSLKALGNAYQATVDTLTQLERLAANPTGQTDNASAPLEIGRGEQYRARLHRYAVRGALERRSTAMKAHLESSMSARADALSARTAPRTDSPRTRWQSVVRLQKKKMWLGRVFGSGAHRIRRSRQRTASIARPQTTILQQQAFGMFVLRRIVPTYAFHLSAREQLSMYGTNWTDLMLWAALIGDQPLARMLWLESAEPLRAALIARRLCLRLSLSYEKLDTKYDDLEQCADTYESWASGMLDQLTQTEDAIDLLTALPCRVEQQEPSRSPSANARSGKLVRLWPGSLLHTAIQAPFPCRKFVSHLHCASTAKLYFAGMYNGSRLAIARHNEASWFMVALQSALNVLTLLSLGLIPCVQLCEVTELGLATVPSKLNGLSDQEGSDGDDDHGSEGFELEESFFNFGDDSPHHGGGNSFGSEAGRSPDSRNASSEIALSPGLGASAANDRAQQACDKGRRRTRSAGVMKPTGWCARCFRRQEELWRMLTDNRRADRTRAYNWFAIPRVRFTVFALSTLTKTSLLAVLLCSCPWQFEGKVSHGASLTPFDEKHYHIRLHAFQYIEAAFWVFWLGRVMEITNQLLRTGWAAFFFSVWNILDAISLSLNALVLALRLTATHAPMTNATVDAMLFHAFQTQAVALFVQVCLLPARVTDRHIICAWHALSPRFLTVRA